MSRSRHQTEQARWRPQNDVATPSSTGQVVTSIPCRNLISAQPKQPRSRPQNGVATSFLLPSLEPGRDIKTRSRPSWRLPYVATSISCRDLVSATMGFPGRDAKSQVMTSHTTTHVATSKMMSRHQLSSAPFLLRRDAIFPCRDLPCCHPCRDLKNDVATSIPTGQITTQIFRLQLQKATPRRDLNSMSRRQPL